MCRRTLFAAEEELRADAANPVAPFIDREEYCAYLDNAEQQVREVVER